MTVKGSTLKNYDSGIVKSCGRKSYEWIKSLLVGAPARMINEINTLRAREQKPTGRINKDTIILRVTK